MAKINTAADTPDRAQRLVVGSFTAADQTSAWVPLKRRFLLLAVGGTGGSVALEVSDDGGTTAINCNLMDGAPNSWAAPVAIFPEVSEETDLLFRLRCATLASGTMRYRLSQ